MNSFSRPERIVPASNAAAFFPPSWAAADGLVLLPQFALLEVAGSGARAFLHTQLTSDVKALGATNAQFSAWCNAQGRMLVNFILHARPAAGGETFCLFMRADRLQGILQRLQKYVLRAKVSLTTRSDLGYLGLCGTKLPSLLKTAGFAPPPEDAMLGVSAQDETTLIRLPDGRCLLAAPQSLLKEYAERFAAQLPTVDASYWQWRDICAALPWIDNATAEAFVPQMLDFEKTGVSFQKGCYPGQEIIARAQYLGEVKRHLYRLFASRPMLPGEDLYADSEPRQAVGKVIAAAPVPNDPGRHAALAVLQDAHAHDIAPIQAQRTAYTQHVDS
ncbi:MAG: folate-binding protein [Zoogloeaceae bacterium]|jgi:folate-binding protein YgfZ|nr:folate-binding protein [Zoogloeaceae bacterium]